MMKNLFRGQVLVVKKLQFLMKVEAKANLNTKQVRRKLEEKGSKNCGRDEIIEGGD
jgi:hypothetical protein